MQPHLCPSPCASPSLDPCSPPVTKPAGETTRHSLVYWHAVVSTALVTALVAAVFVTVLAVTGHQTTITEVMQPPDADLAARERALLAARSTSAAAWPEPSIGEAETSPEIGSRPADRDIPASDVLANKSLDPSAGQPACESYGTAIKFSSRPAQAARQARHDGKLLFLLHVSGNFEEAKFT
ncbi:MAG TPA: hypothetical protein VKE94_08265 [Gemmataceae bacterium]|nr:hypothetical protein [Gemmataceae bacterium]